MPLRDSYSSTWASWSPRASAGSIELSAILSVARRDIPAPTSAPMMKGTSGFLCFMGEYRGVP